MNQAKSTEPEAVRGEIEKIGKAGTEGVTGEIAIDADGQRLSQPFLVTEIADGKVKVLAELTEPGKVDGLPGPSK